MRFASGGRVYALVVAGLLCWQAANAQTNTPPGLAQQAKQYFSAKEWEKAAVEYEGIVKERPSNGQAWFRLGLSRHNLEQFEGAIEAFQQAAALGFAVPAANYNAATGYARLGRKDDAFELLQKSAKAGFSQVQVIEADEDLAALREDARFAEAVQAVRVNSAPCEHLPEYRQFDFWIGEWEVFNPRGQKVGENRIEKHDNGCVLWENWTAAGGGGTGHSINYYDHAKGTYVQLWVSSSAGIILADGAFKDGAMRLTGERLLRNGTRQLYRGTWTPNEDGSVRQFLELSGDGGKTWNVWFDGKYVRKQEASDQ